MQETLNDLIVPWVRHGSELARRMLALADELDDRYAAGASYAAQQIRNVIRTDYDPLPPARPQLGDPPTLRPAVPRAPEPGS